MSTPIYSYPDEVARKWKQERDNLSFLITDLFEALTPPKSGCDCDDSIDQGPRPCVFHRFEEEMRKAMAYTDKPKDGAA